MDDLERWGAALDIAGYWTPWHIATERVTALEAEQAKIIAKWSERETVLLAEIDRLEAERTQTDAAIKTLLEGQSALIAQVKRLTADKAGMVDALDRIESQSVCVGLPAPLDELSSWLVNIAEIAHAALEQHGGGK